MNSTRQIHRGFDSFYIVLSETLDHIALCDHCEHTRVTCIAYTACYEHLTDYELHCTCDNIKACA